LLFEAGDQLFVEIVAADDDRIFETCGIEYLARLNAEVSEVARIKADSG
jgi:hypothetical protein